MQKLPKVLIPMMYMVFLLTLIDTIYSMHHISNLNTRIHQLEDRVYLISTNTRHDHDSLWERQKFTYEMIEYLSKEMDPIVTQFKRDSNMWLYHSKLDTVAWKPKIFYRYHKKWHTKPKKVLYTTGPCMGTDPWYLSQDTLYSFGRIKGGITPTKVQFGNTYALTGDATWSRIYNIKPNPYWRVCNYDDSLITSNTWSFYIRHQMPWLPGGGNLISRVLRRIPEDSIKTWIGRKTYDSLLLPSIETDLK